MFAVIKTGGKQYRVQEGDILQIEKLSTGKGQKVVFDKILLIDDKGKTLIGTPFVDNALVKAEVIENLKDKKVIVFKKKRRKQYKKKRGHRQELTQIRIEEILPSGKAALKEKPVAGRTKEEEKRTIKREVKEASKIKEITDTLETEYLKKPPPRKKVETKTIAKTKIPTMKKEKENGS